MEFVWEVEPLDLAWSVAGQRGERKGATKEAREVFCLIIYLETGIVMVDVGNPDRPNALH